MLARGHVPAWQPNHQIALSGLGNAIALAVRAGAKTGAPSDSSLVTQELHADGTNHEHDGRHDHGHSPGHVWLHARANHWVEEHAHHENLRHATTQIAPTSCCGIGGADNVWCEHEGAPELVGHKGSARATNEEPDRTAGLTEQNNVAGVAGQSECRMASRDLIKV